MTARYRHFAMLVILVIAQLLLNYPSCWADTAERWNITGDYPDPGTGNFRDADISSAPGSVRAIPESSVNGQETSGRVEHHGSLIDSEGTAAYCLSCHDGKTSKVIAYNSSHKFLIAYPPNFREGRFAPLQAVTAAGIKFENGLITCISCHDPGKPSRYHLAVDTPPRVHKLCRVCHTGID